MPVPRELQTERLLLRPWRAEDAAMLLPVLEANRAHLGPWIPARVATPVPVPELAERLAGFAAHFAEGREWRYALVAPDERRILGEVGLFPRAGGLRVPYPEADHVEIGYWLRADATGQGLVTEAARAALAVAARLPGIARAEIHCDARNAPSAAVPRRLGFVLARTVPEPPPAGAAPPARVGEVQVWTYPLTPPPPAGDPASAPDLPRLIAAANAARGWGDGATRASAPDTSDAERRLDALFGVSRTLAVYGTLAPGRTNHHVVSPLGGEWAAGVVEGDLSNEGWGAALGYPAFRPRNGGPAVAVHLLTSTALPAAWPALDRFEGPGYRRVLAPVYRAGVVDAQRLLTVANLYAAAEPPPHERRGAPPIGRGARGAG